MILDWVNSSSPPRCRARWWGDEIALAIERLAAGDHRQPLDIMVPQY
jgi:hypothetical protein